MQNNNQQKYEEAHNEGMVHLRRLMKDQGDKTGKPLTMLHALYLMEVDIPGSGKEKAKELKYPPLDETIIAEFYRHRARMIELLPKPHVSNDGESARERRAA